MTIVKPGRGTNAWLTVKVRNGKLLLSIGVDTLAFAAQRLFDEQAFNESDGGLSEADFFVIDREQFAKDVCHELEREDEAGTNVMHLMLDAAINAAMEQGSLGIVERSELQT